MRSRPSVTVTAIFVAAVLVTNCGRRSASTPPTHAIAGQAVNDVATMEASRDEFRADQPGIDRSVGGRNQAVTAPTISERARTTRLAINAAKDWAIAAHSTSYRDPRAGTWTDRTKASVTGVEAKSEQRQGIGGGGTAWTLIQSNKCVTSLRQLGATVPADAPTSPTRHIVYVAATVVITCATAQIQTFTFAAQLTVVRVSSRWLVADAHH